MPRGFKRALKGEITGTLLAVPGLVELTDRRSFISQPKAIPGECEAARPHWILFGKDKNPIRAEVFRRNREAHGGINRCSKCNRIVVENDDGYFLDICEGPMGGYYVGRGEWHHIRNKPGTRCDCPQNGEVVCGGPGGCHRNEHPQPEFGRSKIIAEKA